MPLPLSDDGGSTLIEFSGASIGKYLESALGSGTQKLMYIVDVVGAKDKTNRQAFFHASKAKGTTRGNLVRHCTVEISAPLKNQPTSYYIYNPRDFKYRV